MRSRSSVSVIGAFLLASTMLVALGAVPAVHATGYTVDQTWCTSEGGTWSFGDICFISGTATINSGDSLDIPSGVALISNVVNNGVITIEGTLETGSFDNYGTFTQTAGGSTEVGTVFNNYGSVSISGSYGITIDVGATFYNYGSFTDSTTFWNDGTFYEECGATFDSTPNQGSGTFVQLTCTTSTTTSTSTTTTTSTTKTTTTTTTPITGVPEFPLGFVLLFAIMVPALLVLRSIRIRKPKGAV